MASIQFTVNGEKCTVTSSTPRETSLNAYLRYALALPGTKAMCREGGCGSCVVTVRARRLPSGEVETFSVNSCLVLVFSCHGWEITTIEGLGNRRDGYNEIQKRVATFNATQCGYCTPGWVMHLNSLQDKNLTMAQLENSFGNTTCRCTGYRPILDTIKSFAVDASPQLCQRVQDMEDLQGCCQSKSICERKSSTKSECDDDWAIINDLTATKDGQTIALTFGNNKFFKVYEVDAIFEILQEFGVDSYMIVDGNTAKGVVETFEYPRILIDVSSVKSLKAYDFDQNLVLGANISLEDCITIFKEIAKTDPNFLYLEAFAEHIDLVAHIPVRKIGSLAGNLMSKHSMPEYPSDVFLIFAAVGAMITVRKGDGSTQSLSMTDFLAYDMQGVLMVNIELPPLSSSHYFRSYKIMPRNQSSLAIVNAAFLLKLNDTTKEIEETKIVFGNISADFVYAKDTEAHLKGKKLFDNQTVQSAINVLSTELKPKDNPPEQSPECRKKLAIGLFYKFILNISESSTLAARYRSGSSLIVRPLSHGTQDYQTDESLYPLNQAVPKYEAKIQSSGEAQYANDVPPLPREVFGAFVLSTIHVGEIDTIDTSEVLEIDGVLAVYTAKDVPGKNTFSKLLLNLITEEEELLASKQVKYYGQPVAIVVAENEELASRVAKTVKVTYKNISSQAPVLTIDQAKKDTKRYVPLPFVITPTTKGENVTKVIKGVYDSNDQYHNYLEPMTCVVVPSNNGFEVHHSTQWMDLTQMSVAQCLGINESDVVVKVTRLGGAFGGKVFRTQQVSAACAVVAKNLNRPCRFILPMQTNLAAMGKRVPAQCEYEVGIDDDGKIQYFNGTYIINKGCSPNDNVIPYVIGALPNCYDAKYFSLNTAVVLTDLPCSTVFRAPGTFDSIATIEHIMEQIALTVQKDVNDVRLLNMRTENNDLPALIEELKTDADYTKRAKDIEQFNNTNRWKKKAIKISVMNFPVEYVGNYSAMVSIYRGDGTVTITTGGIEMGQGVNTKAAQVCAYELGIPLDQVTVLPHHSFTAPNNYASGSSIVSECVCFSVIKACKILKERLEPVKQKLTNPTWKELITSAGDQELDMTAIYTMSEKEEELENYYAYAVAIIEVELDVLTGRFQILRSDIVEDVGMSANPNIDIGQVEGAYIQGIGYFTTEKLVYDKQTGKLLTNRSLNYHVPMVLDIPADFRVKLRYNSKNSTGVLGSKAVGEMGICVSQGITHALRHCIMESRKDSGYDTTSWINIEIPYDAESILKALEVKTEEMVLT